VAKYNRKRLFVDASVQGALVMRAVTYWFYCLVTVAFMMTCWIIFSARPTSSSQLMGLVWGQCGPAFVTSILLLPLVVVDVLRMSNRFVGPLQRIRRALRDMSAGKEVPYIAFRQGDFWCELADDVNRLNQRVKRLQGQSGENCAEVVEDSLTNDEVEAAV